MALTGISLATYLLIATPRADQLSVLNDTEWCALSRALSGVRIKQRIAGSPVLMFVSVTGKGLCLGSRQVLAGSLILVVGLDLPHCR